MDGQSTFRQRYLNHEVEFDDIDEYVELWGMSDTNVTLREYLGLTAEEETVWVEDSDEALEDLLESERG